jgi:hypothetical protein
MHLPRGLVAAVDVPRAAAPSATVRSDPHRRVEERSAARASSRDPLRPSRSASGGCSVAWERGREGASGAADCWPLVLFRFSGDVSLTQLNDYLQRQEAMLARREMMGSLVLTEDLKLWDTPVLRRQADWIKQNVELLRRYSVGAALIIASPVVRGMLKAVLWLQPMPQPHFVTANVDQALDWLRTRFHAAHIEMPPGVQI